jgi:hypothetical protein
LIVNLFARCDSLVQAGLPQDVPHGFNGNCKQASDPCPFEVSGAGAFERFPAPVLTIARKRGHLQ